MQMTTAAFLTGPNLMAAASRCGWGRGLHLLSRTPQYLLNASSSRSPATTSSLKSIIPPYPLLQQPSPCRTHPPCLPFPARHPWAVCPHRLDAAPPFNPHPTLTLGPASRSRLFPVWTLSWLSRRSTTCTRSTICTLGRWGSEHFSPAPSSPSLGERGTVCGEV